MVSFYDQRHWLLFREKYWHHICRPECVYKIIWKTKILCVYSVTGCQHLGWKSIKALRENNRLDGHAVNIGFVTLKAKSMCFTSDSSYMQRQAHTNIPRCVKHSKNEPEKWNICHISFKESALPNFPSKMSPIGWFIAFLIIKKHVELFAW